MGPDNLGLEFSADLKNYYFEAWEQIRTLWGMLAGDGDSNSYEDHTVGNTGIQTHVG